MLPNREAMDRSVCPPLGQTPGRGGRLNSFRETGWSRVTPAHDEPDVCSAASRRASSHRRRWRVALARVTRDSAQKEIDEPAGEFLLGAAHPGELAAQLSRHDAILAVLSRRPAMLVRAGDDRSAGPTQASGLSP
jgi:hypothetical protein